MFCGFHYFQYCKTRKQLKCSFSNLEQGFISFKIYIVGLLSWSTHKFTKMLNGNNNNWMAIWLGEKTVWHWFENMQLQQKTQRMDEIRSRIRSVNNTTLTIEWNIENDIPHLWRKKSIMCTFYSIVTKKCTTRTLLRSWFECDWYNENGSVPYFVYIFKYAFVIANNKLNTQYFQSKPITLFGAKFSLFKCNFISTH